MDAALGLVGTTSLARRVDTNLPPSHHKNNFGGILCRARQQQCLNGTWTASHVGSPRADLRAAAPFTTLQCMI